MTAWIRERCVYAPTLTLRWLVDLRKAERLPYPPQIASHVGVSVSSAVPSRAALAFHSPGAITGAAGKEVRGVTIADAKMASAESPRGANGRGQMCKVGQPKPNGISQTAGTSPAPSVG